MPPITEQDDKQPSSPQSVELIIPVPRPVFERWLDLQLKLFWVGSRYGRLTEVETEYVRIYHPEVSDIEIWDGNIIWLNGRHVFPTQEEEGELIKTVAYFMVHREGPEIEVEGFCPQPRIAWALGGFHQVVGGIVHKWPQAPLWANHSFTSRPTVLPGRPGPASRYREPERRAIAEGWLRAKGSMNQIAYAQQFGISERQLRRWLRDYNL